MNKRAREPHDQHEHHDSCAEIGRQAIAAKEQIDEGVAAGLLQRRIAVGVCAIGARDQRHERRRQQIAKKRVVNVEPERGSEAGAEAGAGVHGDILIRRTLAHGERSLMVK